MKKFALFFLIFVISVCAFCQNYYEAVEDIDLNYKCFKNYQIEIDNGKDADAIYFFDSIGVAVWIRYLENHIEFSLFKKPDSSFELDKRFNPKGFLYNDNVGTSKIIRKEETRRER